MSTHWVGVFAALITGASWGVVGPFGRLLALRGADMVTVVILRTFLTAAILFAWLFLRERQALRISFRDSLPLLFYAVLAVPLTSTGFLYSLKYLTVPAALIIHYTFPLATLLGGLWITREKPTTLQYLAAFLVILGVWTGIFASDASDVGFSLLGVFWGVVAVIGLSGQFILGRALISKKRFSGVPLLLYSNVFGGLFMVVIKHFLSGWSDLALLESLDWYSIVIMSVVGSVLGHGAYCFSLRFISAATASHLCTVEILTGIALAGFMNHEIPTLREINGSLLILLAIFLAALPGDIFSRLRKEKIAL
jgi:drug/metabolite transporter (DMT)-like permease